MGTLGEKSIQKLNFVDPRLAAVIKIAVLACGFDCVVSEGLRSKEQAVINYRKGRTAKELAKVGIKDPPLPGPKVTWTLNSKHITGKAVDVYPLVGGKLDDGMGTDKLRRFDELYHAVMLAAAQQRVRIRYGGDWDEDGKLREAGETDSPHYEIA